MTGAEQRGRFEEVLATADVDRLEPLLPVGVRPRQLKVSTLFLGVLLAMADGRPGHLRRVHRALLDLSPDDQRRLGVTVEWPRGAHELTYRQVERTAGLVVAVLAKDGPDGQAATVLQDLVDALVEASVPERYKSSTTSYAVDWTDLETFARPVAQGEQGGQDHEASWGHRRPNTPGTRHEHFFGYYLSGFTMVRDDGAAGVPELCRRIVVTSCHVDPVPAVVPVLSAMVEGGVAVTDVLSDSGYAHRVPEHWALPVRALGATHVTDLHPHDRGIRGTHEGTILFNGNLYCPKTPAALFVEPLARNARAEQIAAHDVRTAELARHKLGRMTADDPDGYHRVMCPAAMGKVRCPLRPDSLALAHHRPEVLDPPEHPPRCCVQKTITVPASVTAKTAQKHDYPSKAHRESYARRSAAERTFSTVKDPASTDIARGWCRLTGLAAITVFIACVFVVRNERIVYAFEERQRDDARRLEMGLAPRTRRRRRRTINDLVGAASAPP